MNRIIACLLVIFSALDLSAQQPGADVYMFAYFKNNGQDGLHLASSTDGYTWTSMFKDSSVLRPTVSKDKLMRDPCIIRGGDGKFHMVWTVSWHDRSIGYASSTDLIHWSTQQDVPVMAHEDSAKNCWAPEIFYDAASKEYMIYWATTITGRYPKTDTMGDNNHRIYYTLTKDFKTFSKAKVLYDEDFNVIDATIQEIDGKYVMFLKDETLRPVQKNLRVATSKHLTKGYSKPSASITGKYWAEGPTAVKIGEEWVVYFDKYRDHKYGAIASKDLQNWTDVSDRIKVPSGLRHGTIFKVTKAEYDQVSKAKIGE